MSRRRRVHLPDRHTAGLVGRPVLRQRPVRRSKPLREDRKGFKWLDWALEETATAAKALGAVKHTIIICIIWQMLSTGELYSDLGGDYFRKRNPERLIAQLESLGHEVILEEPPQAA